MQQFSAIIIGQATVVVKTNAATARGFHILEEYANKLQKMWENQKKFIAFFRGYRV